MPTQCQLNDKFLTAQRTPLPPIFSAKMRCATSDSQAGCPFASVALENSSLEGRSELSRGQISLVLARHFW